MSLLPRANNTDVGSTAIPCVSWVLLKVLQAAGERCPKEVRRGGEGGGCYGEKKESQFWRFVKQESSIHVCEYRNLGNFRVRKFRAKNFRVKIFSWLTMAHENILTTKKLHAQNFSLD